MIYPIIALIILAVGFSAGWGVRGWRADSEELARQEQIREDTARHEKAVDAAAVKHEQFKSSAAAREQVVVKEVERVVERPVYRNVCLDDDGLRILNSDIAARTSSGVASSAVPSASTPSR